MASAIEWVSVGSLKELECNDIPAKPGVYRIVVPDRMINQISFMSSCENQSAEPYSIKRSEDPKKDAHSLPGKYEKCIDKQIVYIGKASGKRGLQQRLKQYMKYGKNETATHKGGRAVWQIQGAWDLLLEYCCCDNSEQVEQDLLMEYHQQNGTYPLANWRK